MEKEEEDEKEKKKWKITLSHVTKVQLLLAVTRSLPPLPPPPPPLPLPRCRCRRLRHHPARFGFKCGQCLPRAETLFVCGAESHHPLLALFYTPLCLVPACRHDTHAAASHCISLTHNPWQCPTCDLPRRKMQPALPSAAIKRAAKRITVAATGSTTSRTSSSCRIQAAAAASRRSRRSS